MPVKSFLCALALLFFSLSIFAQPSDGEAEKAKLRQEQELAFLEQILNEAKNLRLPENRAFVYAKAANQIWQANEKRARTLFQNAVGDLIEAQNEAVTEKGNQQHYLKNLIYGQSPRWEILQIIAARDAELALDSMIKTRPEKLARLITGYDRDDHSSIQQFARNELHSEQRLIAQAAEQNPQRAVKQLRESLKRSVTGETFNLLQRIYRKDAALAEQLAEEVGQKLLTQKLDENNHDSSLIQQFLSEFGRAESSAENPSLKVPDALLRSLADKIVKHTLRLDNASFYANEDALKIAEKFDPASVAQIRRRQAKLQNQNQNEQYKNYSRLLGSDVSPEELLSQAEKFSGSNRREIYRRAAEKTAFSGNVAQAQTILTEHLPEDEAEQYLSQFNQNLAHQAISAGKFDEAAAFIQRIADENTRLNTLIYLAISVYQKNPKENQSQSLAFLEQARASLSETPGKVGEMNMLLTLASGYANVEPARAFALIESVTSPLNELAEASAVVAKFNDNGNFRHGEYQLNRGQDSVGVYNLGNVLQNLKTNDFERVIQITNRLNRLDLRINLQLSLVDPNGGFLVSVTRRRYPVLVRHR